MQESLNGEPAILKEYPRLPLDRKFKFSCHKELPCFTQCCANVNIFLTPYDVLRMEKALNLTSGEFLEKYTIALILEDQRLPVVVIKMRDDEKKTCPFAVSEGCMVYEDRPWSCRMYPLGLASSKNESGGEEFGFIVDDGLPCMGFNEDKEWTVEEWFLNQGVNIYNKKSETYMQLTLHTCFQEGKGIGPSKTQMFYMVCYDIDRFRRFVFETSFLDRFDIEKEVIEKIETDDEALLNFGYRWLRFSLFGEETMKIREEVEEAKKNELGIISTE